MLTSLVISLALALGGLSVTASFNGSGPPGAQADFNGSGPPGVTADFNGSGPPGQ
ncbi:MAG: hypothetical protein JO164_03150 [Candidatus Eremiobacteraeota bacterium]|nr:hypothetical protein [Candidatus Eremiobacteraeota bacterium]